MLKYIRCHRKKMGWYIWNVAENKRNVLVKNNLEICTVCRNHNTVIISSSVNFLPDKNGESFWIGANDIDIERDWARSQISQNYSSVIGMTVNRIIITMEIVAILNGIIYYTDGMMNHVMLAFSTSAKNRCLMEHKCMRSCYAQLNIYNLSIIKY